MRTSYPTLESQPEKRLVWTVDLPGGQSCQLAKMWGPSAPEVWYYYGGARPLGPGEGPALLRACGYPGRAVTQAENPGECIVRLEAWQLDENPYADTGEKVGMVKRLAITPPVVLPGRGSASSDSRPIADSAAGAALGGV